MGRRAAAASRGLARRSASLRRTSIAYYRPGVKGPQLFLLLGAALLVACGSARDVVRRRAAAELGCEESSVRVEAIGAAGYRASGCRQEVTYTCARGLSCTPDGPATDVVREGERTWDDASLGPLLSGAHDGVIGCFGAARANVEVDVRVSIAGRVSYASEIAGASATEQSCVLTALSAIDLAGTRDTSRTASLHFGRDGRDRIGAATAVAAPTANAAPSPETARAVRALLDARATRILSCAGTGSAGVEASWTASGSLDVHLRGAAGGSAEDECVRAVFDGVVIDPVPDASGSLIHAASAD